MKHYALIGRILTHSYSKQLFDAQHFADTDYRLCSMPSVEGLREWVRHEHIDGFNVTNPYKQAVIPLLDTLSPEARAIGAVNVIRVEHKGKEVILKGYNSDVIGFTQSIEPMLESFHKKALILGTGGAAKAINFGLKSLGLETVLVSRFERPGTVMYKNITPEDIQEYNVIVNCTPCGMFPHTNECPDLPYEAMDSHTLLYDLIYNPDETMFMHKGRERGATVKNGLEMLLLQAFASWEFWNK